jgi:hypothetical protein
VTPEEEWAEMVAPYDAAAVALEYRLLDTTRIPGTDHPNLTMFFHNFFDGSATFLDFGATIARGAPPLRVVLGFHHVQFLTRIKAGGEESWVITNGKPPGQVVFAVPLFLRWLESLMPETVRELEMRAADDLPLVLERHLQEIARRGGRTIPADPDRPLDWRWDIMKEEEENA